MAQRHRLGRDLHRLSRQRQGEGLAQVRTLHTKSHAASAGYVLGGKAACCAAHSQTQRLQAAGLDVRAVS